ncbi:MAG TPA: hypothetical protein VJR29_12440, partial [bacterium]|nr:hypothetical protein [bacterium]
MTKLTALQDVVGKTLRASFFAELKGENQPEASQSALPALLENAGSAIPKPLRPLLSALWTSE